MTKHLIKALEQELETTRSALRKQVTIMKKIEDWLEDEVSCNEELHNEIVCKTNDDFIHFGRRETAECLLNQIEKWEESND